MSYKLWRLTALVVLLLSSVVDLGLRAQCSCQVTNIGNVSIPAVGTCIEYVGGPPVPCITATITSVPGEVPDSGVCSFPDDCPADVAKNCKYATKRFNVTLAPCAAQCWQTLRVFVVFPDGSEIGKIPPAPGATASFDALATGIPDICGQDEKSVFVQFKNEVGAVVFECRARYGCAKCKRMV